MEGLDKFNTPNKIRQLFGLKPVDVPRNSLYGNSDGVNTVETVMNILEKTTINDDDKGQVVRELVENICVRAIGDLDYLSGIDEHLRVFDVENWLDNNPDWRELCRVLNI